MSAELSVPFAPFKPELREFLESAADVGSLSELYSEDGTLIGNGFTFTRMGIRYTVGFSTTAHREL